MKLRKLIISMLLIGSLFLAGCGGSDAPTSSEGSSQDTLEAIKSRDVLKVGVKVDVPGFGYQNPESGEVEGFEIDLAKAIAKKIFDDETKIDPQAVTAKTRGPLLDSGEVDMVIATFTITEERKLSYNFSTPYFTDTVGLLVLKENGFSSLEDLDGKTIGVAQAATSKDAIQEEADNLGIDISFSEFASYPEIKTALTSGRVDAFSVDRSILAGYLDDNTEILPDKFNPQDYGITTKLSNTDFAEFVDEIVVEMKDSGEMEELMNKWGLE